MWKARASTIYRVRGDKLEHRLRRRDAPPHAATALALPRSKTSASFIIAAGEALASKYNYQTLYYAAILAAWQWRADVAGELKGNTHGEPHNSARRGTKSRQAPGALRGERAEHQTVKRAFPLWRRQRCDVPAWGISVRRG